MPERTSTQLIYTPGWRQTYYDSRDTPAWDTHWDKPYISVSHNRLMHAFRTAGFTPTFYQPDWREDSFEQWADGLAGCAKQVVAESDDKRVALAGFSFGGLIAALTSKKLEQSPDVQVIGIIGASVSCNADEHWMRRAFLEEAGLASNMSPQLQTAISESEVPKPSVPTQLYIGTEEYDAMRAFHEELLSTWPQAESIKPPAAHNILDETYLRAIEQNAGRLAVVA